MVVTSLPAARDTGATQDRTASPLRWTVQAPHCAMPQPYLVPVKPRLSRKTQSRGVEGSTSRFTRCRFTLKEIIGRPPLRQEADGIVKAAANLTPIWPTLTTAYEKQPTALTAPGVWAEKDLGLCPPLPAGSSRRR